MPLAFKPTTRTLHRKITKLFQALYLSVTAYLVYHTQFALSRTFFFFFRRPFGGSQPALNFSDRRPSRSSLFILPDATFNVKRFFRFSPSFLKRHPALPCSLANSVFSRCLYRNFGKKSRLQIQAGCKGLCHVLIRPASSAQPAS